MNHRLETVKKIFKEDMGLSWGTAVQKLKKSIIVQKSFFGIENQAELVLILAILRREVQVINENGFALLKYNSLYKDNFKWFRRIAEVNKRRALSAAGKEYRWRKKCEKLEEELRKLKND